LVERGGDAFNKKKKKDKKLVAAETQRFLKTIGKGRQERIGADERREGKEFSR